MPADGEQRRDDSHGSAIVLRHAGKRYDTTGAPAVDDVSLEIAPGEFVVLLGTSGSGKTTLLKMVNRLIEPTSGEIVIDGTDIRSLAAPELRRGIGYVIQQAGLFPHMRVADNIAVVPKLLKWPRAQVNERVRHLLDLVGLPPDRYSRRYPTQLSGGEQQRVGLARAMAAEPRTLLMDEPFGALDAITRTRLQDELLRIHREMRQTILFVTHDVDEALRLASRIVVMDTGRAVQVGTPLELVTRPANAFVAQLVGADSADRRLALIPVLAAIEPGLATPDVNMLPHDATLRDALNALVASSADAMAVQGATGESLGVVTMQSLQRAAAGSPVDSLVDVAVSE
ncbi:MAG TPA: ABC transporter ATP-binding protein [Thermomicrobiales bacterium]|nr:ABC transporter ATP-binding protein [Thermomicrobiales bacterium]